MRVNLVLAVYAQAYFRTNMPIICHKRPRKSRELVGESFHCLGWIEISILVCLESILMIIKLNLNREILNILCNQ